MENSGTFDADSSSGASSDSNFDFDLYVRDILNEIPIFIAQIGWPTLFTVLFLYMIWPYIQQTRRSVSLLSANNSQRKKVLDAEVKRIRAMQHLDLLKSNSESGNKKKNDGKEKGDNTVETEFGDS